MKKICFIVPEISQGGAQIQVIRSVNALTRYTKHLITLVVIKPVDEKYKQLISDIDPKVSILCLEKRPGFISNVYALCKFAAISKDCEILIGFLWLSHIYSVFSTFLNLSLSKPIVGMIRREYPDSYFKNFFNICLHKRINFVFSNSHKPSYLFKLQKLSSNVLAINNIVYPQTKEIPQEKSSTYKIIYPARYIKTKNHSSLIELTEMLLNIEHDIQIYCYGDKSDPYFPILNRQYMRLPSKSKKIFHLNDQLPYNDIIKKINEADLLLCPSLNEGQSNIILEALANCTPVLASNRSVIPDFQPFIKQYTSVVELFDLICSMAEDKYSFTPLNLQEIQKVMATKYSDQAFVATLSRTNLL